MPKKGPAPVEEYRRLVIGEGDDVSWRVRRERDVVHIELHDKQAPRRRSLLGSVTIPYAEVPEFRAAVDEMVRTAPDDWSTRSADRVESLPRMPSLEAPRKVVIPTREAAEWSARLTDGSAVIEARAGREGLLALKVPGHVVPMLMAMLCTLPTTARGRWSFRGGCRAPLWLTTVCVGCVFRGVSRWSTPRRA